MTTKIEGISFISPCHSFFYHKQSPGCEKHKQKQHQNKEASETTKKKNIKVFFFNEKKEKFCYETRGWSVFLFLSHLLNHRDIHLAM